MNEKLVLIDGHSLLFRAFYGMPISMTGPNGLHTNALYGFLAILGKVIEEEKPDYLGVAFDLSAPTFRHELYPEYKGNRGPAPDEFREQVPVIKRLLKEMEIPAASVEGWEADDILGTLAVKAKEQGIQTSLISGDRDLLQIADDAIEIIIPKTKGGKTTYEHYKPKDVVEAFGVDPKGFIELKALMGDTSDNVPGLPGVGPKTAQKILENFGSIEGAYAHLDEVKPKKAMEAMRDHRAELDLSKLLVTIRTDAPVDFDRDAFRMGNIYTEQAYESFKNLGFNSLLSNFKNKTVSAQVRDNSALTLITQLSDVEQAFSRAEGSERCSIAYAEEHGVLYGIVLIADGEHYLICPSEAVSEDFLKERTALVIRNASHISVMDAKSLLKYFGVVEEAELFDCTIAAYLLDPLKSDWSYVSIAASCFEKNVLTREEIFGKSSFDEASKQEDFIQKLGSILDAEAATAYEASGVLAQRLRDADMTSLFETIEMPLAYVLAKMEMRGILTSKEALREYGENLSSRISELQALIWNAAGEEFNINSPKQLGTILFEKMGMEGGKKTKTGYSTAADVLEKLASEHPIVSNILEYRTLTKLKSTYAEGLVNCIEDDGRIRTTFNQTVTATGRLSSTEPNLQNIPMREELGRMIRKCFYPKPGCVFVDADYSQIELRILAHMSGDETLIEAYNTESDIHRMTASQVFHVPFDEVTDLQRRNAKAVNFGIVYGISSFGLSQGLSISRKEAQDYIEQYFETYPRIKKFLDDLVDDAKETGYAVSLFGRRRPIPELKASNFMQRSFGERAAMNSPIQGTAADIMKIAMIRVEQRLQKEMPEASLILQIHDELLVEAPIEYAERAAIILTEEMMRSADLRVPLETDCHAGNNWYEAK